MPAETLLAFGQDLVPYNGEASAESRVLYQLKVGSIVYPTAISRPDIAHTSSKLAAFMQNSSPEHYAAADRALRYLGGTSTYALELGGILDATVEVFEGSSDASFANNKETRRSSKGRHFQLFRGTID